jgi:hypothetical protein
LEAAGAELGGKGVSIITNRGWLSSNPYFRRAFAFREGSAYQFIEDFADVLDSPRVVERVQNDRRAIS